MQINLKNKWMKLFEKIKARGNPNDVYNKLVTLYCEPHRAYHNLSHIAHCLEELKDEEVKHSLNHLNEVEMAIWFHDAIYDTRSKDNEEKSAELAYQISKEIGLPDSFGRRVYDLILATKHEVVPKDINAQILVDIDLSILGQPTGEFDEYERNIRKEYIWVPEEQFKVGRVAILQGFLNRPTIYSTNFFRQKYEDQARRNLEISLARLRQK